MSKKSPIIYVNHILECIDIINEHAPNGREIFSSLTTQDVVLRRLQIMSESCKQLPDVLKNHYPNISWREISDFRNILVHDYLGVNLKIVHRVMTADLPPLQKAVQDMRRVLETEASDEP